MSSTFDKAARAVAMRLMDCPVDPAAFTWEDVNGWTREVAEDAARAVLQAIREQGDEDIYRVAEKVGAIGAEAADFWPAMIDALLASEEPTP